MSDMKQVQCVMQKTVPRLVRIWLLFRGDDQRMDACSDLHSNNPSLFGICRLKGLEMEIVVVDLEYLLDVKSRNIIHRVWFS